MKKMHDFMTRDGNVLVATTGLGWYAYVKRGNPVSSSPPFSINCFRIYNSNG
ncbi:hypothetical protein Hanom_Chr04g00334551 [Helianthus anomalus]